MKPHQSQDTIDKRAAELRSIRHELAEVEQLVHTNPQLARRKLEPLKQRVTNVEAQITELQTSH